MPEMSVWPSANELMVLFESDSGAPILSQMPTGPQSDPNPDPGECDSSNSQGVGKRENTVPKNADLPYIAKE